MRLPLLIAAAITASVFHASEAGTTDHRYKKDEHIELWVNKVSFGCVVIVMQVFRRFDVFFGRLLVHTCPRTSISGDFICIPQLSLPTYSSNSVQRNHFFSLFLFVDNLKKNGTPIIKLTPLCENEFIIKTNFLKLIIGRSLCQPTRSIRILQTPLLRSRHETSSRISRGSRSLE